MVRAVALAVPFLAGCILSFEEAPLPSQELELRPGIISFYGESDGVVELPETVRVGEPFEVTVHTYGGGCESAHSMAVNPSLDVVQLTPFDKTHKAEACALILVRLPHTAVVSFRTPGTKTIRIHGRAVDTRSDDPILREWTVEVE